MVKQNIILTSIAALVIATPAMATVGDTVNAENPAMCTVGDLGVSSGTANATAQYSINSYTCAAGTYLPAGTNWTSDNQYDNSCAQCSSGSFCVGSASSSDANASGKYEYSQSNAKGIQSCPSGYALSDAGSDAQSDCYRACATSDVPHSNAVDGRYYYGDVNQCVPTSNGCVNGYHYVAAAAAPTLPANNAQPDEDTIVAKGNNGTRYCFLDECLDESEWEASDLAQASDLSNGEWKISWTSGATQGTMHGIASCNSTAGNSASAQWNNDSSNWLRPSDTFTSNSTGQYCWCKPTSWTASGGGEQSLAAGWVFAYDRGDASRCANGCAGD